MPEPKQFRPAPKIIWAIAIFGLVAVIAFFTYVAFHAEIYRRQIDAYSRAVSFLGERVVPLTVGTAIALCAAVTWFNSLRLVLNGSLAQGTVVGHKFEEDCYSPVVEFIDRNGSPHRFTSKVGSGKKPYKDGSRVSVIYNPAEEDRAAIRAFWTLWLFPVVLSAFAVLFLAAGFGILGHGK